MIEAFGGIWELGGGGGVTVLSTSFEVVILFFFLIYLFLAALGLRHCARAFSSCDERGVLFVAVWWLLLLRSTGSRRVGFSSCGVWAQ